MKRVRLAAVAALVTLTGCAVPAFAQTAPESQSALRRQIERRFEVLPLANGTLLRPLRSAPGFPKSIEITDDAINLDGMPATGAELRARLGADADAVLRLSYLSAAERKQLFESASTPALPTPAEREPGSSSEGARSPQPPAAQPPEPEVYRDGTRRARGEDRVRFGGSIAVEEGEVVTGDVVAIGGGVRVDGEVTGNAVAIGGGLQLGPHANVIGDAVAVGGPLTRDPAARIGGKIVDLSGMGPFDFSRFRWRVPFGRVVPFAWPFMGAAAGALALMGTLMRVFVLCVFVSIVLFVGRDYVERVSACAAAEPLKAGAVGLLAQLLFLPLLVLTIVLLIITLVGIPLLVLVPFALLALALVSLVGFTAVVYNVGRLANQRVDWHPDNPYVTSFLGILLIVSPLLIARLLGLADWLLFPITGTLVFLGLLSEYVAWTVGFGAVALLRFNRSRAAPPAAPPATA